MHHRTEIPFFGNPDNKSCGQCVYRMTLSHLFPEKTWSISEVDSICGVVKGKHTWQYLPIMTLADMGLDLQIFSTFDTEQFLINPEAYLIEKYGKDGAKNSIGNTDIPKVIAQASEYIHYIKTSKVVRHATDHTPEIAKNLLNDGYLLIMWVNSRKLNNQEGFSGHLILVYDHVGSNFIAHDPGGNDAHGQPENQYQNRIIPEDHLYEACCPKESGKTNILIAIRKSNIT